MTAPDSGRTAPAEFAVITVQYGNPHDTQLLLKSISRLRGAADCEVSIVDNAPAGIPESLPPSLPFPVYRLDSVENRYYWGGAAYAIAERYGKSSALPSWVIICNNDVEFNDETFFERLRALDGATHAIVAPRITSATTRRDQNPLLSSPPRLPTRVRWRLYDSDYRVARAMLALRPALQRASHLIRKRAATAVPDGRIPIYAPHGACVVLSSSFFTKGGTLDTRVPMFAEELTLARTANVLGLTVWHCPALEVLHREHSTTGSGLTKQKYEMERAARRHYFGLKRTIS